LPGICPRCGEKAKLDDLVCYYPAFIKCYVPKGVAKIRAKDKF
jgi:hypothetical protein